MYGYIYLTTNLINHKMYIGMHRYNKPEIDPNYLGSGIVLKKAIQKYGKENFVCEIIECCDTKKQLSEREKYWISFYKAPINEDFYNINDGGLGGHGEFYKQPITENMRDHWQKVCHMPASQKLKTRLSEIRTGVEVSNETRQKLSEKQKRHITVNNGTIQKVIDKDELDKYLSDGYTRGRLPKDYSDRVRKQQQTFFNPENTQNIEAWKHKISQTLSGRKWITDGTNNILVSQSEAEEKVKSGKYTYGKTSKK